MADTGHSSLAPTLVIVVALAHYTLVAKQTLTATVAFVSGKKSGLVISSLFLRHPLLCSEVRSHCET